MRSEAFKSEENQTYLLSVCLVLLTVEDLFVNCFVMCVGAVRVRIMG